MKTMMKQRCPRCASNLFLSDDPLDGPGTLYCLAGHTFYPTPAEGAAVAARTKREVTQAA